MTASAERRLLQAAVAIACLVPLFAGGTGVIEGAAMLKGVSRPLPPDLDSHYRYLSGLLLGIGIGFAACIRGIERRGIAFRLLGTAVIAGGLSRLLSLVETGAPGQGHQLGLVMELGIVPLLMLWQARVARRSTS